ncbi:uncharacterized protein HaLaN_10364, partial [Haematococcus lacustris]
MVQNPAFLSWGAFTSPQQDVSQLAASHCLLWRRVRAPQVRSTGFRPRTIPRCKGREPAVYRLLRKQCNNIILEPETASVRNKRGRYWCALSTAGSTLAAPFNRQLLRHRHGSQTVPAPSTFRPVSGLSSSAMPGPRCDVSASLPRIASEDQLYNNRQGNLPTVGEDDIFGTLGGLELPTGCDLGAMTGSRLSLPAGSPGGLVPSRTLTVMGVPASTTDEELRSIFEAFGDVRGMYTRRKADGVVVVDYYDVRAAASAASTLQGTLMQEQPIHLSFTHPAATDGSLEQGIAQGQITVYNMDPGTTNQHLVWLFSKFGEVQGIHQSPNRPTQ